jgi:hypothetical protein
LAQNITFNGVVYTIPDTGDDSWGLNLENYFIAIPQGALQKTGGVFTLSADVNFGATYGLLSSYFKTRGTNPASSGLIRLNLTDTIAWRNNANSANLALAVNGTDQLTFNGSAIYPGAITALTGDVTASGPGSVASTIGANKVLNSMLRQSAALSLIGRAANSTGDIADISAGSDNTVLLRSGTALLFALLTNNNIDPAAAIAYTKLALTGSIVNADVAALAAIAYSKLNLSSSIVNADIAALAAIAYSKLALTDSILNADISASAAIAYSKLSLALSIVNGDISASAAIALSKLAAMTASRVVVSDGSGLLSPSSVTSTTLGYLDATSSIQTQLDAKVLKSTLTTKGDIYVATASATPARLGVGSDGQLPIADSSQTTGIRWATLNQGAKNYIIYNSFENNATTGWGLGTATLTNAFPSGAPTFGSGASGNLSIAAVSSGKLAGSYSLSLASSAATTAGNFLASDALTLDIEDQAKILGFKFYYSPTVNPSNGNWSGTSSNSFGVAIYDITNSAWIQPAGVYNLVQSSGVGIAQGTFQTPSNMTSFRIVLFNANATSGAITVLLDDFYCGPQAIAFGPPMSSLGDTPWTPTGSWVANSTYTGQWRRVGDCFEGWGKVALAGAPTSASLTINLPSGLSIDTAKISDTSSENSIFGAAAYLDSGVNNFQPGTVAYNNTTSVSLRYSVVSGTSIVSGPTTQAAPFAFGNADIVFFKFLVPITGWSANTVQSSDFDGRICVARYRLSANKTTTAQLDYDTKVYDSHGAVTTGAGWKFSAPSTGYYRISVTTLTTGAVVDNLAIFKNGTVEVILADLNTAATRGGSQTIQLNAGEYFDLRPNGATSTTFNSTSGSIFNEISIEKVLGPAVVQASEVVMARYYGTTTSISGTPAAITFANKTKDSHSAYSGSTFTAPRTGDLEVFAESLVIGTIALNNSGIIYIYKNGAEYSRCRLYFAASITGETLAISDIVPVNAGDTVQIYVSSDATAPSISNAATGNNFVAFIMR